MARRPDLSILRSALALEASLEQYERELLEQAVDPALYQRLAPLFDPAHHQALHAAYAARAGAEEPAPSARRVLEDLLANERAARNFYFRQKEHLAEPELQALFDRMAKEEQAHVDLVRTLIQELEGEP